MIKPHELSRELPVKLSNGAVSTTAKVWEVLTAAGAGNRWGNVVMVEFLLENGADPNKAGAEWSRPLAWARQRGHTEIGETLNSQRGFRRD